MLNAQKNSREKIKQIQTTMEQRMTTKSGHQFRYIQSLNEWTLNVAKDRNSKESDYKAQDYREDLTSLLQVLLEGIEVIGDDEIISVSLYNRFDAESSKLLGYRIPHLIISITIYPRLGGHIARIERAGTCRWGVTREDVSEVDSEIRDKVQKLMRGTV